MVEIEFLRCWWAQARARLETARAADPEYGERGMTTETVIITAVLAALALAVGAIIVAKVTQKANSIPTG